MTKTRTVSKSEINERWYLIDASGLRLGRVASVAAELLLGKNDPKTRDYLLPRNKVVVVNASKLDITEKRKISKIYTNYSGYPGGLRKQTLGELQEKFPERVVEKAIKGMLPKNRRGKAIHATNLYVYTDAGHKHEAQQPEVIDVNNVSI